MKKNVCMIAYTNYKTDPRVRREAETIASLPDYSVFFLSLKQSDHPQKYTLKGVEVNELNISKYQGKSNLSYLTSYIRFMILAFFACSKLMLKNSIDIVHIHNMPNFIIFSAIVPRLLGKKVILDIHDTMIETYAAKFEETSRKTLFRILKGILRLEEVLSCKMAHRLVCVNHVQKEALLSRGIPGDKIVISINVPDPARLTNKKEHIHMKHGNKHFRLVYHGTLAKRLGIDLAIRAVSKLNDKISGIEFHVIGDGDDMQEFINLSSELQIKNRVHFSEKIIPFEELVIALNEMDIEIVPNRKNAATELMLPIKLLDCVALGIPVVVPNLKGIQYYFSDEMVTFFEPDNIDSLVQAILYAYNNRDVIIEKAKNAKKFLEQYGWETHKYDLINMYKTLS